MAGLWLASECASRCREARAVNKGRVTVVECVAWRAAIDGWWMGDGWMATACSDYAA